jgi:hypothetical protein
MTDLRLAIENEHDTSILLVLLGSVQALSRSVPLVVTAFRASCRLFVHLCQLNEGMPFCNVFSWTLC